MEDEGRLQFSLEHVTHNSVFIVERTDWEQLIDISGEPVKLASIPSPITGLVSMASHVMAAGSGIYNSSPGIDVVRHDLADEPYIYNIDHYTVLENLLSTPLYQEAIKVARIEETEELNQLD